jgi:hypothetical protein
MLVTLVVHADHESNVISANTNEDVMQSFKTAQLVLAIFFCVNYLKVIHKRRTAINFLLGVALLSTHAAAPTKHKPEGHQHARSRQQKVCKPDSPFISDDIAKQSHYSLHSLPMA